jgi:hypothetical protein
MTAEFIPMKEIPKYVPGRPSVCTVWRWASRGCRGVRLKTWSVGNRRFTTREAIAEFIATRTADSELARPMDAPAEPMSRARQAAIEKAKAELDAAGV